MRNRTVLTLIAASIAAPAALAQPKLITVPFSGDLAANGNTAVGWVYDGAIAKHVPMKFVRGAGFVRMPGRAPGGGGNLNVSADGSVLASSMDNTTNWGDLNCFTGYTPAGQPRAVQTPCVMPSIAHRYTASSGWVNAGSLPRTIDPVTGRWIGGTNCDYTINSVNDLSGDGRYIVGGAYSAYATTASGNAALGLCGDYFAFRYDSQSGAFDKLPTGSRTTRADAVSSDGGVVVGYDLNASTSQRRFVVWADGAETILDTFGYNGAAVAGDGSCVAAGASLNFSLNNYGIFAMALVKWNHVGNAWVPQNLGVPAEWIDGGDFPVACNGLQVRGVSNDGSTIVGTAYYGGEEGRLVGAARPFIWRAGLNGGVPMDLEAYLATLDPTGESYAGASIYSVAGLSGDGNTLFVTCSDSRAFCESPTQTLQTGFGALLSLDGAGVSNEPPRIAMQPVDMSTRCTWAGWGEPINVSAGGSWPLSYQWQREEPGNPGHWIDLHSACSGLAGQTFPHDGSWEFEGANGPQLRVNVFDADGSKNGLYRCIVSNAYGSVVSNPATLTFLGPINPQNAQSTTGCAANPAVFTVSGVTGVEYSWQFCTSVDNDTWVYLGDGPNNLAAGTITVTGAHAASVTINPGTLPTGSQQLFRCHIADSCNALDLDPVTLTVASSCGVADMGAQGGIAADCGDGTLDNNDFVVFIDYFFNNNPRADVGRQGGLPGADGQFDNNDFVVFIDYFFTGCN